MDPAVAEGLSEEELRWRSFLVALAPYGERLAAQAGAAEYVERFLREAMLRGASTPETARTDREAVEQALDRLVASGALAEADRQRMLDALA